MSAKRMLKTTIATAWDVFAALKGRKPKLTILYYHAVPAEHAAGFEAQMGYLAANANVVAPDYAGALDARRPNVAVAFDDAFRSVREYALPALARHRIPATIYVPTGWLGRAPGWAMESYGDADEVVMSADELLALPRDLIALGSHTVDHPRLTRLDDAEVIHQLIESRQTLETITSCTIDTLAFPYGDHDARVVELARQAGYRLVYTVTPQAIVPEQGDFVRGRTSVEPSDDMSLFALKTRGAFDWMPIASRVKRALRGP